MSYPPPQRPPSDQQQPPIYHYDPNLPPMYRPQNPNMVYQNQPTQGHSQQPQPMIYTITSGGGGPPSIPPPPPPPPPHPMFPEYANQYSASPLMYSQQQQQYQQYQQPPPQAALPIYHPTYPLQLPQPERHPAAPAKSDAYPSAAGAVHRSPTSPIKDAGKLSETNRFRAAATDSSSKNLGKSAKAPESSQLHHFTKQQHVAGWVVKDTLGRQFLGPDDWDSFPVDGSDSEKREWMQQHGFYVCCVECKVLNRDCSHTYPCSDCEANGQKCRLVEPGHTEEACRFGMTCEEPHIDYLDFLDAFLETPRDFIRYWEFPRYLNRSQAHGCQRNGRPCHVRQMPGKGIALPFSRKNQLGYTTEYPPKCICEEFNPPVYQKKKIEIDTYYQHQSNRFIPSKSTAPPPLASNPGNRSMAMSAKETEEMCNTLPVPDHLKSVYDGDTRAWLRAEPGAVYAAWRKFRSSRFANDQFSRLTDIGSRLPSEAPSRGSVRSPLQAQGASIWPADDPSLATQHKHVPDTYFQRKAEEEEEEARRNTSPPEQNATRSRYVQRGDRVRARSPSSSSEESRFVERRKIKKMKRK
ncbi:hypothetical protein KC360_g1618 [Hortaea werneckii]|nr:hypothetical protein KC325_g2204 [Hortaea werneckii]KAI6997655.1 hypothetical protein KC359_g2767 [Hortaea werneckii]KAI7148698.1 hypothetical protein KC344_g1646 [Hortaea werneckii]KAI7178298.1 hypothetical protein KC360_g1618 [Hortaea werneckii]